MKTKLICLFLLGSTIAFGQNIDPKKDLKDISTKPKLMSKAPKKVFIRSFKLYFQMIDEAENTKSGGYQLGGNYKGSAKARLAVGVKGIDAEALQQLTNRLYNDYIDRLKAEGLEIYTASNLPKIDYFDGWDIISGPHINEEQLRGYLMVVPGGFSYFVKKVTGKGKEKTGGAYQDKAYKISKQLNDMIVADVEIIVPSIWLKSSSSTLAQAGGAKVKGGPYLRLSMNSFIKYQSGQFKINAWPQTSSILTLKKDIPIEGVFADQKFKSTASQDFVYVPGYVDYFTVENRKVNVTNYIECDQETYVSKVGEAIQNYMDITFTKFSNALKGIK